MKYLVFLFSITFLLSCSSDEIIKSERKDYFSIYKNLLRGDTDKNSIENQLAKQNKDSKWLAKFNQPIVLISSEDERVHATLVALGNNQEKLTWVSADGISFTFDNGILIATRGYTQDLMALSHTTLKTMFKKIQKDYNKTHRYLNGENDHDDITFICKLSKEVNHNLKILEYSIMADKFTESCKSPNYSYENEYYLLPKTNIVLKSKQWISPSNRSFFSYNYYAFQKF